MLVGDAGGQVDEASGLDGNLSPLGYQDAPPAQGPDVLVLVVAAPGPSGARGEGDEGYPEAPCSRKVRYVVYDDLLDVPVQIDGDYHNLAFFCPVHFRISLENEDKWFAETAERLEGQVKKFLLKPFSLGALNFT